MPPKQHPNNTQLKLIEAEQFAVATYVDARQRHEIINLRFAARLFKHLVPQFLKGGAK